MRSSPGRVGHACIWDVAYLPGKWGSRLALGAPQGVKATVVADKAIQTITSSNASPSRASSLLTVRCASLTGKGARCARKHLSPYLSTLPSFAWEGIFGAEGLPQRECSWQVVE